MFRIKTFIALIIAAACTVFMLQSTTAYAEETTPVVASAQQININSASAEIIATSLKGIGLKKAQAIVEYREKFGDFHDVEELLEVKGVGPATLKKNEGLIVVE